MIDELKRWDYDRGCEVGYEDGRADAIESELQKYTEEYTKQIRADAIDEIKKELIDIIKGNEQFVDWQKEEICLCIECAIDELKEQK